MTFRILIRAFVLFFLAAWGCASGVTPAKRSQATLHYDLAVAQMGKNDMRAALRELLIAVDANPQFHQAHNALGLAYHSLGEGEKSLEHYQKAIAIKPDFSDAYNNMGTVLLAMGRYDEAIDAFKKALADILYATPELPEAHLGWAYFKKGETQKALSHLKSALATNPSFCLGYGWLAQVGLQTKDAMATVMAGKRFERYCVGNEELANNLEPAFIRELRYYYALGLIKSAQVEVARGVLQQCAAPVDKSASMAEEEIAAKCAASLVGL